MTVVSAPNASAGMVTPLPSGNEMFPPNAAETACVVDEIVPAMIAETEADFDGYAALVAAMTTVYGVGRVAGA